MFKSVEKTTWILFALVIVAIYLFALDIPLLGPDEPRYSQVAREMFEREDWVTTTLGGSNWFEKPALLYWLQITFYNLFGVTEFAARLGSALFGLGTIFCLWILGRSVQGSGEDSPEPGVQSPKSDFGNWLMLIGASSIGMVVFSRGASFDIMITFPLTAALVSFFIWETKTSVANEKPFYFLLFTFYFFTGIGLIAKGLIGIVFPFAIVAFYYVLSWKLPNKTFLLSLVWGTILSIAVACLWYLPMYLQNGWEFIDEFFIQHHFQRFTSNKYKHPQPFWFFWVIFPLFTIPWIPFFLAAIWERVLSLKFRVLSLFSQDSKLKTQNPVPSTQYPALSTFTFAWMIVPLVFFSVSGSKLPGYILPAVPAALILTGEYVYRFVQKSDLRKYLVQGLALVTFLIVIILLIFVVPDFAEEDSTRHLVRNADAKGYKTERILNMHTTSHNIEFYGHGRLVRAEDGKQARFSGTTEIVDFMKKEDQESVLVLIPHEFLSQLTESKLVTVDVFDKNAELTMVAVKLKK
jgi:4-amino-4-deoxy-L-arabinose transferase-like glycosyltransferase